MEEFVFGRRQGYYLLVLNLDGPYTGLGNRPGEMAAPGLAFVGPVRFVWAALAPSKTFRVLYNLVVTTIVLLQYSYYNTVHRFLSAIDLQSTVTSSFHVWSDAGERWYLGGDARLVDFDKGYYEEVAVSDSR